MDYSRYFITSQRILLRSVDAETGHREVVDAVVVGTEGGCVDVMLPYPSGGEEEPPLRSGGVYTITAERHGMGLKITGKLERKAESRFRILPNDELQVFSRREYPRVDVTVHLHQRKWSAPLAACRAHWRKALAHLQEKGLPKGLDYPRVQVNLSAGGVGAAIPAGAVGDFHLLIIGLPDGTSPVCALAEVVRKESAASDRNGYVGLRFMQIRREDQEQIHAYVLAELKRAGNDPDKAGAEHLPLMDF